MPTPDKATQIAEAAQRAGGVVDDKGQPVSDAERSAAASAADVIGDDHGDDRGAPPAPRVPPEEPAGKQPIARSPKDDIRDSISKGFREFRNQQAEEDQEDARELREMASLPEEMREVAAADDPRELAGGGEDAGAGGGAEDRRPAAADDNAGKVQIKVNGKELWLTQEELVAEAQKARAADDVLGRSKAEAKEILEEARRIQAEIQAARPASEARTPGAGGKEAQPAAGGEGDQGGGEHHDPYEEAVAAMQYGEPADAKNKFKSVVEKAARDVVREQNEQERYAGESRRSATVTNAFTADEANADLRDPDAEAMIRSRVDRVMREDLVKIGYKAEDVSKVAPDVVAGVHLKARANGYAVTAPEKMLADAAAGYREKFGKPTPTSGEGGNGKAVITAQPSGQVDPETGKPRVIVNVNRDARRAAMPQQPSRTSTPREQPQQRQQDPVTVRGNAFEKMRAARQGPRSPAPR